MLKLYTLIFYCALPLILLRLTWRSIKAPSYRKRWQERLGIYCIPPLRDSIWFHTVSVGEAEAAFPLIKLMQSRHPDAGFLITSTTPTGSARIQQILGDKVAHVYMPYDLPDVIERFIKHFQPGIAIMMEKEIWPNLISICKNKQIPVLIVNARLSQQSAKSYQRISKLSKPALNKISLIATQTEDDRQRFINIGAASQSVKVLGNTKFDVSIDEQTVFAGQNLKLSLFAGRYVLIVGSSHQGEEIVFLKLYPVLKAHIPELLLLIAPRHPERFQAVKKLCEEQQLKVLMRTDKPKSLTNCDVYLADSMGELKMLYAAADVAFVAGSLAPVGGHNVLEPAAAGTPILFGPQMFNFQEVADKMLAMGAAIQCQDETAILHALLQLYNQPELSNAMVKKAHDFIQLNQGATLKIADTLENYIK
jgi:3-deoxy-D-manno-octulosonic-acid transferase